MMKWLGVFLSKTEVTDEQGLGFKPILANGLKLGASLAMVAEQIPWLRWMFPLEEEAFAKHGAGRDRLTRAIMEEHTQARNKSGGAKQNFVDATGREGTKWDGTGRDKTGRNGERAKMPSDGNKEEEGDGDVIILCSTDVERVVPGGEAHQTWERTPRPIPFRLVPRTKRYPKEPKTNREVRKDKMRLIKYPRVQQKAQEQHWSCINTKIAKFKKMRLESARVEIDEDSTRMEHVLGFKYFK
ncbi:hypothetical protein TB2_019831 [Malus domestica]